MSNKVAGKFTAFINESFFNESFFQIVFISKHNITFDVDRLFYRLRMRIIYRAILQDSILRLTIFQIEKVSFFEDYNFYSKNIDQSFPIFCCISQWCTDFMNRNFLWIRHLNNSDEYFLPYALKVAFFAELCAKPRQSSMLPTQVFHRRMYNSNYETSHIIFSIQPNKHHLQ